MLKRLNIFSEGFSNLLKQLLTDAMKTFVRISLEIGMHRSKEYGLLVEKRVGITETGFGNLEDF